MSPIVVLVGPPGAGKTTVARLLADRLDCEFRDTDVDIENAVGKPIPEIFIDDGEEHFRELERQAVTRALAEHKGVLALGGGAVTTPAIREALAGHRVAFLDVSLAPAVARVGMNASRPLLLGNVRAKLKMLLDERRALYSDVATVRILTDELEPAAVAATICEQLELLP